MKLDEAREHLRGVPFITDDQARVLYEHIIRRGPKSVLELGFAHGTSVCYMAAALDEIGEGHITAVDLEMGREWQQPSIEELLDRMGLGTYVTVARERLSYTWFLKKVIEEQTSDHVCQPLYDFCYIDGPKNWTVDGCAFFLVDKLLNTGGTILFDDLNWSYDGARDWSLEKLEECGIMVSQMDDDERTTPHVQRIFELLVQQHPDYSNFRVHAPDWAWADKVSSPVKTISFEEIKPLRQRARHQVGSLAQRVRTKLG